jgi:hypothetical protein
MKVPTNAAVGLSALASAVLISAGGIVVLEQAAPGPALMRVVEGQVEDCDGAGVEVFGGRDRDRDGVLAAGETELSGVVCSVGGRLEVWYEPEPLEDPTLEQAARAGERPRPLMEFRDHPWDESCPTGGFLLVIGLDRDRDSLLSAQEITERRPLCAVPSATRYAGSR